MGLSNLINHLSGKTHRDRSRALNRRERSLDQREKKVTEKEHRLQKKREHWKKKLAHKEQELEARRREMREELEKIADQKATGFPWLARAYAKYFQLQDRRAAKYLETKKHPARKTAREIRRDIAKKRREAEEKWRILRARVDYYETLFPWLTELVDEDIDDLLIQVREERCDESTDAPSEDPVRRWIPEGQYRSLTTAERNQMALERYLESRKSQWKIGRDYERYVGYVWEQKGYAVEYYGIEHGLEDLGRDLIATKGGETCIIQCKMWSRHKTIHEKHLFQLYGSTVKYRIQNERESHSRQMSMFDDRPIGWIQPIFVTTTTLSSMAHKVAEALGVRVLEEYEYDPSYPMIKCNVARGTGEKIYHLPFDQKYDDVIIEPERGERYVKTAHEAERLGFRRAHRWRGDR